MESPFRHEGLASFSPLGPAERIILIYLDIEKCIVFRSGDKSLRRFLTLFNVNAQGGDPLSKTDPLIKG
ncbi:hypothetical protein FKM82_023594 [Ascaphus truei]